MPYDSSASLSRQVSQSLAGSREHPGTGCVDSFILHGSDEEVWAAMLKGREAGRTRLLGVSNVSILHLEQMAATHAEPRAFVQNRCCARLRWDHEIRKFCGARKIIYQGFSLPTANADIVRHPLIAAAARRHGVTPPQIVFSFAQSIAILPLTGTSDPTHMKRDLASSGIPLTPEEMRTLEHFPIQE